MGEWLEFQEKPNLEFWCTPAEALFKRKKIIKSEITEC